MSLIFIADPIPSFNKGEHALLEGIISSIRKYCKDVEFVKISRNYKEDSLRYKKLCKVISNDNWFSIIKNYINCDALIVGHDSSVCYHSIFIGKIMRKPLIIYAGSLGGYKSQLGKKISKYLLEKVELIMFREKVSFDLAKKMGISNEYMYQVADVAFLLEPCSESESSQIINKEIGETGSKYIGVTFTREMCEYTNSNDGNDNNYQKAIKTKAKILDQLAEKYKVKIIFLPHCIGPGNLDDRKIAEDVIKEMDNQSAVFSIIEDYTPSELKGLIGKCWIFIGERTHSVIAALSQGVPSLCLTHSKDVRTHGIIGEMLAQKKYVYNVNKFNQDEILSLIDNLIKEHEVIGNELRSIMGEIREKALLTGKLFYEHIFK